MSYNQHLQIHAPGPALCSKTGAKSSLDFPGWKVPSCSLAPYPEALLCEQPLEPSCGSGWSSVVVVAALGKGTPFTLLPLVGWELPDVCSLCISHPYRGAWRSSWAILSCVTRRPPGTWGSWGTRGARGSISTLITLEEVHRHGETKQCWQGMVSGCPRHMHCIPVPPAPWPLLSQRNLTAASSWES